MQLLDPPTNKLNFNTSSFTHISDKEYTILPNEIYYSIFKIDNTELKDSYNKNIGSLDLDITIKINNKGNEKIFVNQFGNITPIPKEDSIEIIYIFNFILNYNNTEYKSSYYISNPEYVKSIPVFLQIPLFEYDFTLYVNNEPLNSLYKLNLEINNNLFKNINNEKKIINIDYTYNSPNIILTSFTPLPLPILSESFYYEESSFKLTKVSEN